MINGVMCRQSGCPKCAVEEEKRRASEPAWAGSGEGSAGGDRQNSGGIDVPGYASVSFSNFDVRQRWFDHDRGEFVYGQVLFPKVKTFGAVVNYAERICGGFPVANLVLYGSPGAGKTHLSISVLRRCREAGRSVQFCNSSDLFASLKSAMSANDWGLVERIFDRLCSVDVLVLDDLGMTSGSEYEVNAIYRVLNVRESRCRPSIVTTNFAIDALERWLSPSVFSRLMAFRSVPEGAQGSGQAAAPLVIELAYDDYRQPQPLPGDRPTQ